METLLDFGRMETAKPRLKLRADDLSSVTADLVAEFRSDPSSGCHPIDFSPNGALPAVHLDREAFARALWNLLDNAAMYSPDGSPIQVSVTRDNGFAVVAVTDHGPAVRADDRRRIFKKFVRGTESDVSR